MLIMDSLLSLAIAKTLDARADDMASCFMALAYSMMGARIRDHHSRHLFRLTGSIQKRPVRAPTYSQLPYPGISFLWP